MCVWVCVHVYMCACVHVCVCVKGQCSPQHLYLITLVRVRMLVLTEEGRGREQHTGRGLGALWMEDCCPTTASGQEDVSWVNGEDILRSRSKVQLVHVSSVFVCVFYVFYVAV